MPAVNGNHGTPDVVVRTDDRHGRIPNLQMAPGVGLAANPPNEDLRTPVDVKKPGHATVAAYVVTLQGKHLQGGGMTAPGWKNATLDSLEFVVAQVEDFEVVVLPQYAIGEALDQVVRQIEKVEGLLVGEELWPKGSDEVFVEVNGRQVLKVCEGFCCYEADVVVVEGETNEIVQAFESLRVDRIYLVSVQIQNPQFVGVAEDAASQVRQSILAQVDYSDVGQVSECQWVDRRDAIPVQVEFPQLPEADQRMLCN